MQRPPSTSFSEIVSALQRRTLIRYSLKEMPPTSMSTGITGTNLWGGGPRTPNRLLPITCPHPQRVCPSVMHQVNLPKQPQSSRPDDGGFRTVGWIVALGTGVLRPPPHIPGLCIYTSGSNADANPIRTPIKPIKTDPDPSSPARFQHHRGLSRSLNPRDLHHDHSGIFFTAPLWGIHRF